MESVLGFLHRNANHPSQHLHDNLSHRNPRRLSRIIINRSILHHIRPHNLDTRLRQSTKNLEQFPRRPSTRLNRASSRRKGYSNHYS